MLTSCEDCRRSTAGACPLHPRTIASPAVNYHWPSSDSHLGADPPIELVEWEDTTNVAGWQDTDELASFATDGAWKATNVGYLVHEDDTCVVLAARRTDDGAHVGLAERIPKRAITRRRTIG